MWDELFYQHINFKWFGKGKFSVTRRKEITTLNIDYIIVNMRIYFLINFIKIALTVVVKISILH